MERIMTVHNGVDSSKFFPLISGGGGDAGPPTVISLARIDPLKDIKTLMRSADIVRREIPEVRFHLYGDVWDEDYYNDCLSLHRELNLGDTFEFAGHTSSPANVYQQGDVVVLSSVSEAFPYAVVEAMMCGRAIIATAVGGVKEALADCGIMVKPRDPQGMAESCIRLLKKPELRAELGRSASARARERFTMEHMTHAIRGVYHESKGYPQVQA